MVTEHEYMQLEKRRALLIESLYELAEIIVSIEDKPNILWNVFVVFGWVLPLGALFSCYVILSNKKRKPCKSTFFAVFHEKIRRTFNTQREDTFETILTGVNRVLQFTKEAPTVFLVLVPRGGMSVATQVVTLLVHSTLMAYGYPAGQSDVAHLFVDGSEYTSVSDKWVFYDCLKKKLARFGISAVFNFDSLLPQTVKTFTLLVSVTTAPYSESVIILVVDVKNRFTEREKETLTPNDLGRQFLREKFSPYFGEQELFNLTKEIGRRCILINP